MKKFLPTIFLIFAVTLTALAQTKYLVGDSVKSSDLSKVWALPAITTGLVGVSDTATLSNKTLTSPTINGGTASGTIVNFADAFGGMYRNIAISGTSTISNTLTNNGTITGGIINGTTILSSGVSDTTIVAKDSTTTFVDNTTPSKKFQFEASGITINTTRSFSLPDDSGQMVCASCTQTLTNKIFNGGTVSGSTITGQTVADFDDNKITLRDNADTTKQAQFQLSSISSGQTRTYTWPDISGTVPLLNQAQTFSALQTFSSGLTASGTITMNSDIVMALGKCVDFSATANSSGTVTAEKFCDAEKGTFTPLIQGAANGSTTGTYTTQDGWYAKFDDIVLFSLRVAWSAHSGTGDLRVTGLPFIITSSAAGNAGVTSIHLDSYTITAGHYVSMGYLIGGENRLTAYSNATGGGAGTNLSIDTAATVIMTGFYKTP
jgi:uncharacterized spore protein YtfJ